jgi:hypothetical protein
VKQTVQDELEKHFLNVLQKVAKPPRVLLMVIKPFAVSLFDNWILI